MLKKDLALWLLVAPFVTSAVEAQPMSCVDLFQPSIETRLERLSPAFLQIYLQVQALRPDLVNGKQMPKWQDFNQLETLIKSVREAKKSLNTPEAQAELESIASQIVRELGQKPALDALAHAHRTHVPNDRYAPTEYELKLLYQFTLNKLNRELPAGVRIPLQRLPVDLRRPRINREAREFMVEFEKAFESRFPTTGFATFEEYEKAIRGSDDPHIKKAVEMIDKGQIEVVIRRPESARFWVPKVGFHNQYVTGSSNGSFLPSQRQRAEARLYDLFDSDSNPDQLGLSAYRSQDVEFMPKYATLRPSRDSGVTYAHNASYQYGSDFYVVNLAEVQDRLSWSHGDSLGVGWGDGKIEFWDASFVPWKYRLLMVDFLAGSLARNELGVPERGSLLKVSWAPSRYWETQILGALELKNISSFEFSQNPPSGRFLLDLIERGIPIYDCRTWPSVEWKPTEEDIRKAKEDQ